MGVIDLSKFLKHRHKKDVSKQNTTTLKILKEKENKIQIESAQHQFNFEASSRWGSICLVWATFQQMWNKQSLWTKVISSDRSSLRHYTPLPIYICFIFTRPNDTTLLWYQYNIRNSYNKQANKQRIVKDKQTQQTNKHYKCNKQTKISATRASIFMFPDILLFCCNIQQQNLRPI